MSIALESYSKLLNDIKHIVNHQKELAKLKGENFNVFSILNVETRENTAHSAFLGELLNPKGSHGLGNTFLSLFVNQLEVSSHIDIETSFLKLEEHIGRRNDKKEVGGRVDIFIKDDNGRTLCIENKIHATDQNAQIARYCNYNLGNNIVLYLNLDGSKPDKNSNNKKEEGLDFFIISYKDDIIEWLHACLKEAASLPILRETIYQYIILIKKLTNQLSDKKMEEQVKDVIIKNYKAARLIGSNIGKIELEQTEVFITEVKKRLELELGSSWLVKKSDDLNKTWTGITVRHITWNENVCIKLEGASKIPWNNSIYGIKATKDKVNREQIKQALQAVTLFESGFKESNVWVYYKEILKFAQVSEREKLFKEVPRSSLVVSLSDAIILMCHECKELLSNL